MQKGRNRLQGRESKRTNPVICRYRDSIGNMSAELDDEFLFNCFVENGAIDQLIDLNSPKMILAGAAGAGKTAIVRHILATQEHAHQIDPLEMGMDYVTNSDVLNFLNRIGADLDLLFQVLWKHVICIELIRLKYKISNENKAKNFVARLFELFRNNERRKSAVDYLAQWEKKFFLGMDRNIKELTTHYEDSITAAAQIDVHAFKTQSDFESKISSEEKSELVRRFKKVVDTTQLNELGRVIEMLSDADLNDNMDCFYILIDRLDDNWVDQSIRFRLIRALIESLKGFRKIRTLKIIVALRTDVIERVIADNKDVGFQKSKFWDLAVDLRWSKPELRTLVEKRINLLYRKKYTAENVFFENVFPRKGGNRDSFEYLISRTLLRPRDIILFINDCMAQAAGKSEILAGQIREAEPQFSAKKLRALAEEWLSCFPSLGLLLENCRILEGSASLADVSIEEIQNRVVLPLATTDAYFKDPLHSSAIALMENPCIASTRDFIREMVSVLYRVGAIGIQRAPTASLEYSHTHQSIIDATTIHDDWAMHVHAMFRAALNLDSRESMGADLPVNT
jgi:hypothetical protein